MLRIARNDQQEGLHNGLTILTGVDFQLHFGVLMDAYPILKFQSFQSGIIIVANIKVFTGGNRGLFNETVRHCI